MALILAQIGFNVHNFAKIVSPGSSTFTRVLDFAPLVAAGFAIPQFVPQIVRLRRTGDIAGVSWSWATLTSVNNGAWIVYFALSRFWTALVPATSATTLAGLLAVMVARRQRRSRRGAMVIGAWACILTVALVVAGRRGLGSALTAAFILQVTPSVWTAYRTDRPTGISAGTWLLVLGELSCWTVYGFHRADPRLLVLGLTGIATSLLMLARVRCGGRASAPRAQGAVGREWILTVRSDVGGGGDGEAGPASAAPRWRRQTVDPPSRP
jgi:hypothetical protein